MIDADGIAASLPADPVPRRCWRVLLPLSDVVRLGRCRRSSASTPYSSRRTAFAPVPPCRVLIGFECETLAVELQIIDEAEGRVIVGQLLPARAGVVYVRHSQGDTLAEADDHGRFQAEHIPRGPLGLRIDVRVGDGSATVTTDWIAR